MNHNKKIETTDTLLELSESESVDGVFVALDPVGPGVNVFVRIVDPLDSIDPPARTETLRVADETPGEGWSFVGSVTLADASNVRTWSVWRLDPS